MTTERFCPEEKEVVDQRSIVIRNFSTNTTEDELELLVELAADLPEDDPEPQIFFSATGDSTAALVRFGNDLTAGGNIYIFLEPGHRDLLSGYYRAKYTF